MSEQATQAMCCGSSPQQTMSIHTKKITDACRDKDCIEDLRVYLTRGSQCTLDASGNVRVRCADLLHAYIDVENVAFDRNHYCVDVTFYYRILADAITGPGRPGTLIGLAVFSKRAVLCGEDSRAKIFTSQTRLCDVDGPTLASTNRPTAVVEVLEPMVLSSRIREICECTCGENIVQIPQSIRNFFDEELVLTGERRQLFVTLGQFSIIRLERDAQLIVPVVDYSIPCKECCDSAGCTEDPCEMFSRIPFPTRQFAPNGCDRAEDCGCC